MCNLKVAIAYKNIKGMTFSVYDYVGKIID